MAQIFVCDRCRKELTNRRTLLMFKPKRQKIDISVFKFDPSGMNKTSANHSFELCDDCANRLGEFLNYCLKRNWKLH